jgi:hypothetical protein
MLFTLAKIAMDTSLFRDAGEEAADLADFTLLGEQINDRVPAGCWRSTIARQKRAPHSGRPFSATAWVYFLFSTGLEDLADSPGFSPRWAA